MTQEIEPLPDLPVVVFKGQSAYSAMRTIADELAKGFGSDTITIDLMSGNEALQVLRDLPGVKLAVGFNGMGMDLKVDERFPLWERFNIPYVAYLVDHPIWQTRRLHAMSYSTSLITVPNRSHLPFTAKHLMPNNTCAFLPQAGMPCDRDIAMKSWEERDIDVLFLGSYYELPSLDRYSEAMVKRLSSNRAGCYHDLLEDVFRQEDVWLGPLPALSCMREAQIYLRAKERQATCGALMKLRLEDNGYNVLLHGTEQPDGEVNYAVALKLMERAKIVVSHSPLAYEGAHERVFDAALRGCCIFSSPSLYLDEIGLHYAPVTPMFEEKLYDNLLQTLHDGAKLDQEHNYDLVNGAHTWEHRAKQLARGIL